MPVLSDSNPVTSTNNKSCWFLDPRTAEAKECSLCLFVSGCVASEVKAACCLYSTDWTRVPAVQFEGKAGEDRELKWGQIGSPVGCFSCCTGSVSVQHIWPAAAEEGKKNFSSPPNFWSCFFSYLLLHWFSLLPFNKPGQGAKPAPNYLCFC